MPYLEQVQKDAIEPELLKVLEAVEGLRAAAELDGRKPLSHETALKYIVCYLYMAWFRGGYTSLSHGLGALEAAKQEVYRREVAPYEDRAAARNGDIFAEGC